MQPVPTAQGGCTHTGPCSCDLLTWAAVATQVRPKPPTAAEAVADMAAWVRGNFPDGESGIVYVLTRKDAETLAEVQSGGACWAWECTGPLR